MHTIQESIKFLTSLSAEFESAERLNDAKSLSRAAYLLSLVSSAHQIDGQWWSSKKEEPLIIDDLGEGEG